MEVEVEILELKKQTTMELNHLSEEDLFFTFKRLQNELELLEIQ